MNDAWDFYQCQVDSKPASIMLDMGIHGDTPMPALPDMVYLRLYLREPGPHGMTTSAEAETLYPFDDALTETAKEFNALYVGRVTTDGFRDFVFYAGTGTAFEPELAAAASKLSGYRFDVGSRPDPEWGVYRNYLYPPGRIIQVMKNRGVYDALGKEGDDLTKPREVDHWVYFSTPYARELFKQKCVKEGFQVRVTHDDGHKDMKFGIQLFRQDTPSPDTFDDVTVMLFDFAEAAGGHYDGWETPVLESHAR